ncbi:MAG: hypothetical protein JWM57_1543 [Phycisphaerales bacterium]|nr:hypothetical protein [Phycisphaerales bacterium]
MKQATESAKPRFETRDDDYQQAQVLFRAAYDLLPPDNESPPESALRLLRAAAKAWSRHFDHERRDL